MRSELIDIRTGEQSRVYDITRYCAAFVKDEQDGLLHVFVPHATAGLAIIETGAGSDEDLLTSIDAVLPRRKGWQHQHGSAGHGRDHVVPAYLAPTATVVVLGGALQLGTWQSVCVVDTNVDNPNRRVRLSFLPG